MSVNIMDSNSRTNKKLVAEKTNKLITATDKYPDLPAGGLIIKVRNFTVFQYIYITIIFISLAHYLH